MTNEKRRTLMNTMLSRTRLLAVALAMLGALTALAADIPLDPNLVALFADLHVTMDNKNQHQRAGLERCVREVLALNPRPANVLFYGDLSIDRGATNDYRMLRTLVKPLDDAGVRWHAAFGNHDRRAPFFAIFRDAPPRHSCRIGWCRWLKRRMPISCCWTPASKARCTVAWTTRSALGCGPY
jgi:hypothetical protein